MIRPVTLPCLLVTLALFATPAAQAGPIPAGQFTVEVVLTQSVELFPGTPFNPGPVPFTVTAGATGTLTVTHTMQVGTSLTTSPFVHLTGTMPAPLPPIPYEILAGTPDLPTSQGVISNIVQDGNDKLISGDFVEQAYFKQVLPALGATVYSDPNQAAVFTAHLTGLPYPVGTTFRSPERVNLYLQIGPGYDPSRDLLIGQSFDRVLTVVPEPTSLALLGLGALGILGYVRRRKSPCNP